MGYCPHAYFLPKKHLLFAKDYLGMVFTSGHTFIHMTAAGRLSSQDPFYRYVVVPRLKTISPSLREGSRGDSKGGDAIDDTDVTNGYPDIDGYIQDGMKICVK